MASPQPVPFVQFSKELLDAAIRAPWPATHLQVVLTVVRLTYGDHGKRQAEISLGTLEKATGRDHHHVKRTLDSLLAEGVLVEVRAPAFGRTRVLALQKDYERWGRFAVSPAQVPDFLRHDWQGVPVDPQGEQEHGGAGAPQGGEQEHPPGGAGAPQEGEQEHPTKEETRAIRDKEHSPAHADDGFCDFWSNYPRRVGKDEAQKRWQRLSRSDRRSATAAAGHLAEYVRESGQELRFIPFPATFIGPKRRWTDWQDGRPPGYSGSNGRGNAPAQNSYQGERTDRDREFFTNTPEADEVTP